MTLPSESLRAVKQTREFLRSILTENRRPQFALKELASSCLRHYPFDFNLDKYWSEHVCEHGNDRIFCRKCRPIETATVDNKCVGYYRKQHECSTGTDEVQHECSKEYIDELEQELEDVMCDATTTKYRRIRIKALLCNKMNVTSDKVQVNEHKEEEV